MNIIQKETDELLRRDAIAESEEELGVTWKDDELVVANAFGKLQEIGEQKKAHAILQMDSYWCMPQAEYIACIERLGFKRIYYKAFSAEHCGSVTEGEHFIYWLADKAILLKFDTYGKTGGINGGNFYYNIRPKTDNFAARSSGGMRGNVWCGSHDCREAIKHHITMLSEQGEFLTKWVEQPFLWLLNWSDTKNEGYDYEAINKAIIKQFPKEVKEAIKGK